MVPNGQDSGDNKGSSFEGKSETMEIHRVMNPKSRRKPTPGRNFRSSENTGVLQPTPHVEAERDRNHPENASKAL